MTPQRRKIHIGAEILAVAVIAPILWHIATEDKKLSADESDFLKALAIGTVAVDGWLLWQWHKARLQ